MWDQRGTAIVVLIDALQIEQRADTSSERVHQSSECQISSNFLNWPIKSKSSNALFVGRAMARRFSSILAMNGKNAQKHQQKETNWNKCPESPAVRHSSFRHCNKCIWHHYEKGTILWLWNMASTDRQYSLHFMLSGVNLMMPDRMDE